MGPLQLLCRKFNSLWTILLLLILVLKCAFRIGKHIAGKRPNTLISDGARNFNDAFNKEFYTNTNPRTRHIRHIRLQGDHNNNKMERFNGEVRDREKVMRNLKRKDTPILRAYPKNR